MDEVEPTVHRGFSVGEIGPDRRREESAEAEFAHRKTTQIDVVEADTQSLAHDASRPVAASEELGPDRAGLSGCRAADHRVDAVGVLREALQRPAEPDVDLRSTGFENGLEGRLEQCL